MIPERFVTEYPERCGQLFDMLERPARDADLCRVNPFPHP
jgi:hypothetical protein